MITTRTELTLQMTKLLANMMTDVKRDQIKAQRHLHYARAE